MADRGTDLPPIPDDAHRSSCRCATWCCSRASCCRSASAGCASIAAAQEAARSQRPLGVIAAARPADEDPAPEQLHDVGTVADILRYVTAPDGAHHIVIQGQQRFRVLEYPAGLSVPGRAHRAHRGAGDDQPPRSRRAWSISRSARSRRCSSCRRRRAELVNAVQAIPTPAAGADLVASFIDIKVEEKQEILETIDVKARLDKVLRDARPPRSRCCSSRARSASRPRRASTAASASTSCASSCKAIQKELGEERGHRAPSSPSSTRRSPRPSMPEEVEAAGAQGAQAPRAHARGRGRVLDDAHLSRLADRAALVGAERRTRSTSPQARQILDEDHYGLDKIKRRILEYLAVRKLNPTGKSPILCFVGPPGVGKTSLGQSIARATGRKFVRASLGGVHDEAEIRGHRRTYIGALPGNIIQAIRKAGTRNPVFMLDEMDKLGASFHGDPSLGAARGARPRAELDLPRQLPGRAVRPQPGDVHRHRQRARRDPGAAARPHGGDRAAGLHRGREGRDRAALPGQAPARGERPQAGAGRDQRGGAPRDRARLHARGRRAQPRAADRRGVPQRRGADRRGQRRAGRGSSRRTCTRSWAPAQVESEVAMRTSVPGVATGLAWTPVGGDILFVEATRMPGQRQADPDRPARRRDEGERAGGAEPGQVARPPARHRREPVREERHPRPRAGRRDPQGRPARRRRDVHGARLAADRPHRAQRHRDDRRDQPARPRAAGRRHQGEGAGGAPRRASGA